MNYQRIFTILVLLSIAGLACKNTETAKGQYFSTSNGPVEFQFPAGWFQNPEKHPYDLQCFSKDESLTTGVFLFNEGDLEESTGPQQVLQRQIDDLRSKRQNFTILEDLQTVPLGDKKLTTVVYSGEKDSKKYNYKFTVIEFNDAPRLIPVLVQVARPSEWASGKPILEEIARSARIRPAP